MKRAPRLEGRLAQDLGVWLLRRGPAATPAERDLEDFLEACNLKAARALGEAAQKRRRRARAA